MSNKKRTIKYLYVASSSYSGSTLLAFLLNAHPDIVSVSEMDGWRYNKNTHFLCSCGRALQECTFFQYIYRIFKEEGFNFDFRNFGTAYILSDIDIVNRWLTTSISRIHNSKAENLRDSLVWRIPSLSKMLSKIDLSNETFVKASLDYSKAQVFADACKDPFRLRHLKRIESYDICIIYLTRDPRGVVHSMKKYSGLDTSTCIRLWLYEQADISRIIKEFPVHNLIRISYEEICNNTHEALNGIFRFMGLPSHYYDKSLSLGEHHILGNKMRLKKLSKISESKNWKELTFSEQDIIKRKIQDFDKKIRDPVVSEILRNYLETF